ncbi:hypothetical protein RHGRI_025585 [Rhododendron griersonianum]|uniref:Ribulose-phosphate 3-epimerase n=1 Tax=Rhododendron griersonianum TaxID=479676 RepID=A0AAV6IPS4_9ERIC|nr:hypothetical protein RHGRI_025585 [Rhododendron griersonianum]
MFLEHLCLSCGLHVGGGINPDNALSYIEEGASLVIIASALWTDGCKMEFPKGSWSVAKEIRGLNSDQENEKVRVCLLLLAGSHRRLLGPRRS